MDFGRLPSVEGVDFRLPDDDPVLREVLGGRRAVDARVLVGTPRFADPGFAGTLYPERVRPPDQLRLYAKSFDCLELNSTWYGYDRDLLAHWASQVPDSFRFLAKLPATITHEKRLAACEQDVAAFGDALGALGKKLGLAWALLPPDFGPGELDDLAAFVRSVPFRLAVELRHQAGVGVGLTEFRHQLLGARELLPVPHDPDLREELALGLCLAERPDALEHDRQL